MEETVKTKKTVSRKATAKSLGLFKLINEVVLATKDSRKVVPRKAMVFIEELQSRLGFATKEEAAILSAIVDRFYDHRINECDIARHFDVRPIEILSEMDAIDDLVKREVLVKIIDSDGYVTYRIPMEVVNSLRKGELNLAPKTESRANMMHHEDIKEKTLFYNEHVTKDVNRLRELLKPECMSRVLKRMDDKGMRRGFTCIFYGSPGTGKTETVLQLARETKRDIMLVDVPSIRSKYVGDTEKNIKRVFDRYRYAANGSDHAPILVFNEADAILTTRNEGGITDVDKMENAMQNIILQEMENLEGIMIATTNLTGNLDSAFERRFLYKIEFDKPTAKERCHIWMAMLPDLTDDQAYDLAERFDFSGGQIENIARKRIVSDILDDREGIDMEDIIESCKTELLNKKSLNKIGFQ